jgi:Spherulation-specific family 4
VVVNPFNGPGLDDLPDENYQREIQKLTCHPNVRVVGYVHTTWAKRDLSLVFKDIEKYAQWPERSGIPGLKVTGVFVDETPNIYDADAEAYLAKLREHVKKMPGGDENVVRISHPESYSTRSGLIIDPGYSQSRIRSRCRFPAPGRLNRNIRGYLPHFRDKNLKCRLFRVGLVHD